MPGLIVGDTKFSFTTRWKIELCMAGFVIRTPITIIIIIIIIIIIVIIITLALM